MLHFYYIFKRYLCFVGKIFRECVDVDNIFEFQKLNALRDYVNKLRF